MKTKQKLEKDLRKIMINAPTVEHKIMIANTLLKLLKRG